MVYKDTTLISYFDGNPNFNAKTKSGANERQSLASNRILEEIDEYLS